MRRKRDGECYVSTTGFLDVIDHAENIAFVECCRVFVGMENAETNALQDTGDAKNSVVIMGNSIFVELPLAWIDVTFVETDENTLEAQLFLAMLQQFDKVLSRQL